MTESSEISEITEVMSLAPRERRLVKGLLSGLSESNAMRAAGYAESTIRAGTGRVCHRDRIQQGIRAAMEAAGISVDLLAERMREGLDATTPDRTMVMKSGNIVEIRGGPDYKIRHRYLETALRVGGHNPGKEARFSESYEEQILRLRGVHTKNSIHVENIAVAGLS